MTRKYPHLRSWNLDFKDIAIILVHLSLSAGVLLLVIDKSSLIRLFLSLKHPSCFPSPTAGTLEFSDTHSDMSYVFINDSSQTNVPLLQACIDGDLPFAKRLLETGCDPNIRDNRGRTGLHLAAARGNVDICRLLHKFGADLLATDYQGNTALHLCGHVDTIQFLVSNGLKIDIW